MDETMIFALIFAGAGYVAVAVLSSALNFMVALKSPPNRRAAWTVGIPYALSSLAATITLLVYARDLSPPFPVAWWEPPFLFAPGAVIMFLLRRWGYRKNWIPDEDVTQDIKLANDDWRVGIIALVLVIGAVAARVLWRLYLRS